MPRTAAKVAVNAVQLSRAARSPESSSCRKTVATAAGTAGRESLILAHYPVPAHVFPGPEIPSHQSFALLDPLGRDPGRGQRVGLPVEVLFRGRHPGVAKIDPPLRPNHTRSDHEAMR